MANKDLWRWLLFEISFKAGTIWISQVVKITWKLSFSKKKVLYWFKHIDQWFDFFQEWLSADYRNVFFQHESNQNQATTVRFCLSNHRTEQPAWYINCNSKIVHRWLQVFLPTFSHYNIGKVWEKSDFILQNIWNKKMLPLN